MSYSHKQRKREKEPPPPYQDPRQLFIGQLPLDVTEEGVGNLLSQYGEVEHVQLLRGPGGGPKGCAFVHMRDPKNGDEAIAKLSRKVQIEGSNRPLFVARGGSKNIEKNTSGTRVYVANISRDSKEDDLRKRFSEYGDIVELHVMKEHKDYRKTALVIYSLKEDADRAIAEVHGKIKDGSHPRPLIARAADTKVSLDPQTGPVLGKIKVIANPSRPKYAQPVVVPPPVGVPGYPPVPYMIPPPGAYPGAYPPGYPVPYPQYYPVPPYTDSRLSTRHRSSSSSDRRHSHRSPSRSVSPPAYPSPPRSSHRSSGGGSGAYPQPPNSSRDHGSRKSSRQSRQPRSPSRSRTRSRSPSRSRSRSSSPKRTNTYTYSSTPTTTTKYVSQPGQYHYQTPQPTSGQYYTGTSYGNSYGGNSSTSYNGSSSTYPTSYPTSTYPAYPTYDNSRSKRTR